MDADAIRDLFQGLGEVRIRRMFGGQGVFSDELMFALEAGGELYLKADETSVGAFRDAGSRQFFYMKEGRPMPLNLWRYAELASEGFVCCVDRMRDLLGVTAKVDIVDGLAQTAAWYRDAGWLRQ